MKTLNTLPQINDPLDKRRLNPENKKLQHELNRVLHILSRRGRLVKIRKVVTVDVSMVVALVVARPVISIPTLLRDMDACGYEASLNVEWKTRFPTGIYGLSDKFLLSFDIRANTVTLTVK